MNENKAQRNGKIHSKFIWKWVYIDEMIYKGKYDGMKLNR